VYRRIRSKCDISGVRRANDPRSGDLHHIAVRLKSRIRKRWKNLAALAALKYMKTGGRIIMIGSCVGERMMTPGLVPYSATKGAVKMFTQG
jgi:NAD(P)-dependent dehydrogenase (short-subunit alcohol dehydrogenase family)